MTSERFHRLWRWLRWPLLAGTVVTAAVLVAAANYLLELDERITSTFEGRRWSVPAQVFAQPLELYPGAALTPQLLSRELTRLGYQAGTRTDRPGRFQRVGERLRVHLREFRFMERQRASQLVSFDFDAPSGGNRLEAISDSSGRPIPLLRLEPAMIGSFFPSHGEDRLILAPEAVPKLLTDTLKAVEDQHFDEHAGFDLRGILRALWANLRAGEVRQGGSTLTQQLVKSYYLDNRQTFGRKLRELAMAIILDWRFDKADLLNAYVNEIYLGQDGTRAVHGFGLGAQFYFAKPLQELSTAEIATLVAVIRGPSYYNPWRHGDRLLERRGLVLDKMHQAGLIDEAALTLASAQPLGIERGTRQGGVYYPDFMDLVRRQLDAEYDAEALASQGLRIFTTLVPRTQDAVSTALAEGTAALGRDRELPADALQGAVVVSASQTGDVEALAGSRNAAIAGFNRALNARRPVGSLIKPVVYLTALERGRHLASHIDDAPLSLPRPGQAPWRPTNFDGETHGSVPLIRALGDSLNLATEALGLEGGVEHVADRFEALTGQAPANRYPSLLLGAEDMTPLAVAELYGVFASGGFRTPANAVVAVLDELGRPLTRRQLSLEQRIDPAPAAALGRALNAVMTHGTGRSSAFSQAGVAGKTGTSDDFRDSWFVGYDDRRLAVVWLGTDDNQSTHLTGASGALRIWDALMGELGVQPLSPATAGELAQVDYQTGLAARPDCAATVTIPLPPDAELDVMPGCNDRGLGGRLRRWLKRD